MPAGMRCRAFWGALLCPAMSCGALKEAFRPAAAAERDRRGEACSAVRGCFVTPCGERCSMACNRPRRFCARSAAGTKKLSRLNGMCHSPLTVFSGSPGQ